MDEIDRLEGIYQLYEEWKERSNLGSGEGGGEVQVDLKEIVEQLSTYLDD